MEEKHYTSERAIQILISLLKAHNIKKVIASPGATNVTFVGSIMHDSFFEIYSCVDERSAAYMACGLAAQSGEPVVLSCTGATASRNYMPGLTEAYYRKLPVLAVTSTQDMSRIGHLRAQVIDRRTPLNDIVKLSEQIQYVKDETDEWDVNIKLNRAILELYHRGGGPVHINLTTNYSKDYSIKELPETRIIKRYTQKDTLPVLSDEKVAVFVGNHKKFSEKETKAIDNFCAVHNAVVFCDHTSGYYGKYRVQFAVVMSQEMQITPLRNLDTLIHIGEVSGDSPSLSLNASKVWRVSEDGELRDTFRKLDSVFEMPEDFFFEYYGKGEAKSSSFLENCLDEIEKVRSSLPELPLSNAWIASKTAHLIPKNSILHLSIYNTLRNWNFFDVDKTIETSCNTGGFGIDGILSTALGASLDNKERLTFVVIGDLAFFYDMNTLGNRHVNNNLRVLLVNNGKGTEFRNYNHPGAIFGDESDIYIAAAGHFGNKSDILVKHYAEDLGFEYFSAKTKEEYLENLDRFVSSELTEKPIFFEVFTNSEDESNALKAMRNISSNTVGKMRGLVKDVIGRKGVDFAKKIIKR